jgi:2-phosphoglycerate kinase
VTAVNDETQPPIVLIGGANGAGKTYLAGQLAAELGFDHRLGTGFVREVVRAESDPTRYPFLFSYSFAPPDPIGTLTRQARRLRPAVLRCIRRARAEGTSLIVEGTHLLPELYAEAADVDRYIMLRIPPDPGEYHRRVNGRGHTRRALAPGDVEAMRAMDAYLATEAARYGITVVEAGQSLADVRKLLDLRVP